MYSLFIYCAVFKECNIFKFGLQYKTGLTRLDTHHNQISSTLNNVGHQYNISLKPT